MPKGIPADALDPSFLLQHAERLTSSSDAARPYTVDARRAASAAYYAAYHAVTGATSRLLFGEGWLHGVRLLSHGAVLEASRLVSRLGPLSAPDPGNDPRKVRDRSLWRIFQEVGGARPDLLEVMEALRSLKDAREVADYDRAQKIGRANARDIVDQATLITRFFESGRLHDEDTKAFLALAALKA